MAAFEINLVGLAVNLLTPGITWLQGVGDPTANDGVDGNLWFDTADEVAWRKRDGAWALLHDGPVAAQLETEPEVPFWDGAAIEQALVLGDSLPQKIPAVVVGLVADDYDLGAARETGVHQRANARLGVWHVVKCRNTTRNAGGSAVDPLGQIVGATRDVLQGWLPAGVRRSAADPVRLQRGRLVQIANGRAVWLDEYLFSWRPAGRSARTT